MNMKATSSRSPGSQARPVAHRNTAMPNEAHTWNCQARVSRWRVGVEECMVVGARRRWLNTGRMLRPRGAKAADIPTQ